MYSGISPYGHNSHSLTVTQNFKPYIFILNLTHQFFVPPTLLNKAHSNMLFSSIWEDATKFAIVGTHLCYYTVFSICLDCGNPY